MSRYLNPAPQILDSDGNPIAKAKLFFFEPGTTTPRTIYTDAGLSVPGTNPQIANSAGRYDGIFLDGVYRVVQQDASGTPTGFDGITIWDEDPVGDTATGQLDPWLNDSSYNIPDVVVGSDDKVYRTLIDNNQGNDPTVTPTLWEEVRFERAWNANVTYSEFDSVVGSNGVAYVSKSDSNTGNNPVTDTSFTFWDLPTNESLYKGNNKALWPTIANNVTDAAHDIDFGAGYILDSTGDELIHLPTLMTKQIDAVWAAGTGAGGRFSGVSLTADTTYYCALIKKDSDGSIDAGFDDNISVTNIPTGYTAYKVIGRLTTGATSDIVAFTQKGDYFELKTPVRAFSTATASATALSVSLGVVPEGDGIVADINVGLRSTSGSDLYVLVTSLSQDDLAPSLSIRTLFASLDTPIADNRINVPTNSLGQVRHRESAAGAIGGGGPLSIDVYGWYDERLL